MCFKQVIGIISIIFYRLRLLDRTMSSLVALYRTINRSAYSTKFRSRKKCVNSTLTGRFVGGALIQCNVCAMLSRCSEFRSSCARLSVAKEASNSYQRTQFFVSKPMIVSVSVSFLVVGGGVAKSWSKLYRTTTTRDKKQ